MLIFIIAHLYSKYVLAVHDDHCSSCIMYLYELQNILFFVKSLQDPEDNLNISSIISFSMSYPSSGTNKLSHKLFHKTDYCHFYLNRLFCLWNTLPAGTIDLSVIQFDQKIPLKILYGSFCTEFQL